MSDQLSTSVNVDHIKADDRNALERLLGKPLDRGQQVLISAYTPGSTPAPEDKTNAKQVIDTILAKAQKNIRDQQIPEAEVDATIDEAIADARRRK